MSMSFEAYTKEKGTYGYTIEAVRERVFNAVMNIDSDWWANAEQDEYADFLRMSQAERQLYAHYEAKECMREIMAMDVADVETLAEYDDLLA